MKSKGSKKFSWEEFIKGVYKEVATRPILQDPDKFSEKVKWRNDSVLSQGPYRILKSKKECFLLFRTNFLNSSKRDSFITWNQKVWKSSSE